jgi:SagB-type dehydrogenase family enzyme
MHTKTCIAAMVMAAWASWVWAAELTDIDLPAPRTQGGKPLMQALAERRSSRSFHSRSLPLPLVSDLLWAACGINRPESGKRTAPSARNWQEVEVYVVMAQGAFRYDAAANRLTTVADQDLRRLAGSQEFVAAAPLNLVYVADMSRMTAASAEDRLLYAAADTGFISQNVYLFCASENLATVVRASVERTALASALRLDAQQRIVLVQSVGFPAISSP